MNPCVGKGRRTLLEKRLNSMSARRNAATTPSLRALRHRLRLVEGGQEGRFARRLRENGGPLRRTIIDTIQVNLGKVCNQACSHCHVDAGPKRTESMGAEAIERILALLEASPEVQTVDITGGAPELNPHFRHLVRRARELGRHVIDRCNLTILLEPGQEDLVDFLAEHVVEVVSSMPCYTADNVDKQRGAGVFGRSIEGLKRLNARGYGDGESGLVLNLVYNPGGAFLPPAQDKLQVDYEARLSADFGVVFDQLFTITNMPIARFSTWLHKQGKTAEYMDLLDGSFNPATLPALMCRSQLSVAWDGRIYDCDFNQMLDMPAAAPVSHCDQATIFVLNSIADLHHGPIAIADHCLGCTAGAGSSCSGNLG